MRCKEESLSKEEGTLGW